METLLNLDEIEEVGANRIGKKAWAYYYSGSDDQVSKQLNIAVYSSLLFRPRVFIDVSVTDLSTTLLGHRVALPFFVSPAALANLADPAGEHGVAQACARFGVMQIISNNASMSPEHIMQDCVPGQIFGWQLYCQIEKEKSEAMLARIGRLSDKIKFICLTLDTPTPGKREDDQRSAFPSGNGIKWGTPTGPSETPAGWDSAGIGAKLFVGTDPSLTWATTLPWLKAHTNLPIVLKGITSHEDAYIAAQHAPQVKGIFLSNHGGRALDGAPPPIHTLLEIRKYCPEVLDKLEVWVDGGIRRGTDVVKALCLGAKGVGLGRGPLWGLAAGGIRGVERTFEILKEEVETCMKLLGANKIEELSMKHINTRAIDFHIYDGQSGIDGLEPRPYS